MDLEEVSLHNKVVAVMAFILLLVRFVCLARVAFGAQGLKSVYKWRELLTSWCRAWWQKRNAKEDERINGLVTAKMRDWEVNHFRQWIKMMSYLCLFVSLLHVRKIFLGEDRNFTERTDVPFYTIYCILTLLDRCPSLVTHGRINCVYGMMALMSCVSGAPGICPVDGLVAFMGALKAPTFSANMSRLQVTPVLFWSAAQAITWVAHIHVAGIMNSYIKFIVSAEVAWVVVNTACVWILRSSVQRSFRKEIEAKMLRHEQSAFRGLLRMVCDVVIELDSRLCVVGPARDLCTFLLRGSSRIAEGTPLVDLMVREEDKVKFDRVCFSPEGPHAMHVGMRDGSGTLMQVEMFCSQFEGLDGEPRRYLVGLREFCDQPQSAAALPQELDVLEHVGPMRPQIVVLDATAPQLSIINISDGLACLTGAATGGKFVRYVQNSRTFTCWMESQLNAFLDTVGDADGDSSNGGGSNTEAPRTSEGPRSSRHQAEAFDKTLQVRLRPRAGSDSSHISATCMISFDDSTTELLLEPESHVWVQLEFRDIVRAPGPFRSRDSERSRSGSPRATSLLDLSTNIVASVQADTVDNTGGGELRSL